MTLHIKKTSWIARHVINKWLYKARTRGEEWGARWEKLFMAGGLINTYHYNIITILKRPFASRNDDDKKRELVRLGFLQLMFWTKKKQKKHEMSTRQYYATIYKSIGNTNTFINGDLILSCSSIWYNTLYTGNCDDNFHKVT